VVLVIETKHFNLVMP